MSKKEKGLKILALQITNARKIKFAEITPEGDIVTLVGKNEAGKSTIMQAIKYALTGEKEPDFVTHGEDAASIKLKIGDGEAAYEINQRVKADGTVTLVVKNQDGFKPTSPRKFINDLVEGGLACDPLAFTTMTKKDRRKTLVQLLGIGDELNRLDAKEKEVFDERTFAKRELKKQEAFTEGLEKELEEAGIENPQSIDVTALNEDLQVFFERDKEVQKTRSNIKNLEFRRDGLCDKRDATLTEINKLQEQVRLNGIEIEELTDEITTIDCAELKRAATDNSTLIETTKADIANATKTNTEYAKYKSWMEAGAEFQKLTVAAEELTEIIESLRDDKTTLLTNAPMPLKGLALSLEGDDIIYNDTAFDGLSDGAKLLVSFNMAVAMTGAVRVVLIKDASRLDTDNRKLIEELAIEKDVQLWVEYPDTGDNQKGIIIEEGEVKYV